MPAPTLSEAITQYGRDAYLLTVGKERPHTSHVSVDVRGTVIGCALGASAAKNVSREPNVSLFWPPKECAGPSLSAGFGPGRWRTDLVGEISARIPPLA
jgi:hypothetical protein